mmetsp:Transcript_16892/g.31741  ORF Transcript_16892/g.31741 Transcript_16892/m.31741 type:complete len:173 (+) Transcript_16892:1865-2383(+)
MLRHGSLLSYPLFPAMSFKPLCFALLVSCAISVNLVVRVCVYINVKKTCEIFLYVSVNSTKLYLQNKTAMYKKLIMYAKIISPAPVLRQYNAIYVSYPACKDMKEYSTLYLGNGTIVSYFASKMMCYEVLSSNTFTMDCCASGSVTDCTTSLNPTDFFTLSLLVVFVTSSLK